MSSMGARNIIVSEVSMFLGQVPIPAVIHYVWLNVRSHLTTHFSTKDVFVLNPTSPSSLLMLSYISYRRPLSTSSFHLFSTPKRYDKKD